MGVNPFWLSCWCSLHISIGAGGESVKAKNKLGKLLIIVHRKESIGSDITGEREKTAGRRGINYRCYNSSSCLQTSQCDWLCCFHCACCYWLVKTIFASHLQCMASRPMAFKPCSNYYRNIHLWFSFGTVFFKQDEVKGQLTTEGAAKHLPLAKTYGWACKRIITTVRIYASYCTCYTVKNNLVTNSTHRRIKHSAASLTDTDVGEGSRKRRDICLMGAVTFLQRRPWIHCLYSRHIHHALGPCRFFTISQLVHWALI